MPFGVDLIPQVNFGAALGHLTGGHGDVFPGIDFSRGGHGTSTSGGVVGTIGNSGPNVVANLGPNQPSGHVLGVSTNVPNTPSTVYSGSGSVYSPGGYYTGPSAAEIAAQKAYDTYKGQANKALDQLLGQYNTAKQTTNSNYNTQSNQLQSGYNAAKNNYDDANTQARQDQLRQDNQIRVGTHNAYENLMNLLGAFGGGASSVAMNWAPEAAQKFQNAQLGGVDQNTAANLRSLNTNWGNYQNDFNDRKKQLADQKNQALADAESQYNTTKGQLHDILSAISKQSVDPSSIGSELSSVRASIPNNKFVAPTFTGNTPVYHAPNLANFEIANPTANMTTQAPGNSSVHTPAIVALLNQQKRQNVVA